MIRRLLIFGFALCLYADTPQDVRDFLQTAAQALTDRNAGAFEAAFHPAPPGLHSSVTKLLAQFDVQSAIAIRKDEGDTQSRSLQLDWQLDLTERGNFGAITHRTHQVNCQLKKESGAWRIASFDAAGLFVPPDVNGAWLAVASAAAGLTEAATPNGAAEGDIPAVNTQKFMEAFDPRMPGYTALRDSVLGIEQSGTVETTLDLVRNEGDDRTRTIEVSWLLNLISRETHVSIVQRTENVTCTVERQGKNWHIVKIEPVSFFAPPK